MLLSEKEERSRHFLLALRAGIPVIILISLVFYTMFMKEGMLTINTKDSILLASLTFIAIYFIYFFMEMSVQESIIDQTTHGFNKKTFIKKLQKSKVKSIACLNIENLSSLSENHSIEQVDDFLYSIINKLNIYFERYGISNTIISRYSGSNFFIAVNEDTQNLNIILEAVVKENKIINDMEPNYRFAIITNTHNDFEKSISQLQDMISAQSSASKKYKHNIKDAKDLTDIEKNIINSLQQKNLILSFRPLLNTHSNKVDIYEVSIKLKSNTNKDILPKVFLPTINRLGLGRKYDFALMERIVEVLPLVEKHISFTFNLSPFSLRNDVFQEKFFSHIKAKKIDPSRLIIQLYERKTHHDLSGYLMTLKKFRSKNIRICIDNFGSSNASMEYMKHFKFDMIQFDRDYVTNLDDETSYAMLNSLIKMSKDLNIKTVAKWVDNEDQKKKLRVLGIQYLQGFGIEKPLSEEALIEKYN